MFDETYFVRQNRATYFNIDNDFRAIGAEKLGMHDIYYRLSRMATPMVDYSEIKRILADIDALPLTPNEPSGFRRYPYAWGKASKRFKEIAEIAEKEGCLVTAGKNYVRASLLAHSGQLFCKPEWAEKKALQIERAVCFHKAAGYIGLEEHHIPYRGHTLPGYLWVPKDTPNPPLVIMAPGANSTKEELYRWAPALVERGMAAFMYDGPGQGEFTGIQQTALVMRLEEYHTVFTAIIDYLVASISDRVDTSRIGIWGQSLGGHLAIRCFEYEKRPMAVVSMSGPPDMSYWPYLPGDALEEGRDMCGFKSFTETWEYLQKNGDAHAVAKYVKVPILMIHGARDDLMPEDGVRKLAQEIGPTAEFVVYPDGNHGIFNYDLIVTDSASDWLANKLLRR